MFDLIGPLVPTEPVTILIVVILCLVLTWQYQRVRGLPPGPYGLPFLGYVFFLDRDRMSQQFGELCRKYKSDIVSVTVFGRQFVVLNTYDLVKEVFQKRSDAADRVEFSLFSSLDDDYTGIIGTSGRQWKEVRRFSISTLRDFGMGRVGAEEMIQNEAEILCEMIRMHGNEAFNPQAYINTAVSNIICGMVFGQRFEHQDKEFARALAGMNSLLTRINKPSIFFLLRFKFAREFVIKDLYQGMLGDYNDFAHFVTARIKEHKADYSGQTSDLIYCYLKEMEQGRDPDIFDDRMLSSLITDFFLAGSETTYTTLRWCLLAMAAFPDVQKKVQDELDHVIGDRAPSMIDKKQTPYSEAVLSEVQRHFTLVPVGAGHANLADDIYINGYRIPQRSFIIANLNGIHHDKQYWKNPDEFDPENFLDDGKVVNLDRLIPFAIGRRACAGEALARMELYLFFVSLLKNFDIKLETDDTKPDLVGNQYGVYQPKPFKLRMTTRCYFY